MLAENLVNPQTLSKSSILCNTQAKPNIGQKGSDETDQKASESDVGKGSVF